MYVTRKDTGKAIESVVSIGEKKAGTKYSDWYSDHSTPKNCMMHFIVPLSNSELKSLSNIIDLSATPHCLPFPTSRYSLVCIIVTLRNSSIQVTDMGLSIIATSVDLLPQIRAIISRLPPQNPFHGPSMMIHIAQ
jgi:hypothetical protein